MQTTITPVYHCKPCLHQATVLDIYLLLLCTWSQAPKQHQGHQRHSATTTAPQTVHIRWERHLNRLKLYGSDPKLDQIEADIKKYLQSKQQDSSSSFALSAQAFKHVVTGGKELLQSLKQQTGVESLSLDVKNKKLVVEGPAAALGAAEAAVLALGVQPAASAAAATEQGGVGSNADITEAASECPVCR